MQLKSRRNQSRWRKWRWKIILATGVVTGALCFFLRGPLERQLAAHREQKSLAQAKAFAAKGDFTSAMLATRAAATANPNGIDTQREAASLLEEAGAPASVKQREQVSQLVPASVPDRVAWARAALRFKDLASAGRALDRFTPGQRTTPEVARLLVALALAQRQPAAARAALAAAVEKNPSDSRLAFELASLDLRGANPAGFSAAQQKMQALAASGPLHQEARLELLLIASDRGHLDEAATLADQIADDPRSTFDDQIRRLNAQRALHGGWITPESLQKAFSHAQKTSDQAQLADWLMLTGQPRKALDWIATLDPAAQDSPALITVRANASAALRQWPELLELVRRGAWGPISPDAINMVQTAKSMADFSQSDESLTLWKKALQGEFNNPPGLRILHRLTVLWTLPEHKKITLEAIAQYSPDSDWAVQQLAAAAFARKDTADLLKIWTLALHLQPQNQSIANDWALVSLLLNPGVPSPEVQQRIAELSSADPAPPRFALTRALALWRSHQPQPALALLETLPTEELRRPGAALYYGALLVANDRRADAAPYLALAKTAKLLPEETALLETASSSKTDRLILERSTPAKS